MKYASVSDERARSVPHVLGLTIGVVLIAMLPWEVGFYTLIRILVTAGVAWTIYAARTFDASPPATIVLVVVALIFNPIAPVYLSRDLWILIDIATAASLGWVWVQLRNQVFQNAEASYGEHPGPLPPRSRDYGLRENPQRTVELRPSLGAGDPIDRDLRALGLGPDYWAAEEPSATTGSPVSLDFDGLPGRPPVKSIASRVDISTAVMTKKLADGLVRYVSENCRDFDFFAGGTFFIDGEILALEQESRVLREGEGDTLRIKEVKIHTGVLSMVLALEGGSRLSSWLASERSDQIVEATRPLLKILFQLYGDSLPQEISNRSAELHKAYLEFLASTSDSS